MASSPWIATTMGNTAFASISMAGRSFIVIRPGAFPFNRARTIASFKRLAALDVQTACFGHGDPIESGAGDRIREVAVRLTP